jgi:2'-5' RNA ligase
VGKAAEPRGALADLLKDAPKAKASAVRKQLLGNFPEDALGWIAKAEWHGPAEVPLELTDFRADATWAAAHQMDHVARFARDLKAGRKVDPVVAVALPDHRHVRIIDGHHRAMACKKLGWPVRMWIGHVDSKATRDMAYQTHSSQLHQGADPANKAASGYDLSPGSGMISLDLPEGAIASLPGGVDDHHVTVVYLGKGLSDEAFAMACERARAAAASAPGPLTGVFSGTGTFAPSEGSDWKVPVFIPARIPGAEKIRASLADLSASEHKDWKPHVTLAYLDEGDPLPAAGAAVPVTFTHLSVHRGDDVRRFPLGG